MSGLDTSPWVRVTLSAALVVSVSVAAAVGLAVKGRRPRGEESPGEAASLGPAAIAHAAAGVVTSNPVVVQSAFHERVEILRAQLRDSPDDAALALGLARLLHDGHLLEEAAEQYRAAIRLDPTNGAAYYDAATALADLGRWSEAESVLRERLRLAPDDPVAMYNLGATFANRGDAEGAGEWWVRALASAPSPDLRSRIEGSIARLGRAPPP